MRLTRYRMGIRKSTERGVEVYVQDGRGNLFLREFEPSEHVLDHARDAWRASKDGWREIPAPPLTSGLSLVWEGNGARLYVSGEAAITRANLKECGIDRIVTLNVIGDDTRREIQGHFGGETPARHVDAPIMDVLPQYRPPEDVERARRALDGLHHALTNGESALVHCLMGVHRSVSAAVVALVRAGHFTDHYTAYLHVQRGRALAGWLPETVGWMERVGAGAAAVDAA